MRQLLSFACLAILLGLTTAVMAAETGDQLTVMGGEVAAPTILRGSAVKPKAAPKRASRANRIQIAAGRRIWFADPATGDVRACVVRKTSTVGVRQVRCTSGSSSRFRRGFGRHFRH